MRIRQQDMDAIARTLRACRPAPQTPNRYTWNNVVDSLADLFRGRMGSEGFNVEQFFREVNAD